MSDKVECDRPAIARPGTLTGTTQRVLQCETCCFETKADVVGGFSGLSARGKTHLRPVTDRLNAETLEEWVFMIWGLKRHQLEEFKEIAYKKFDEWRVDFSK